MAASGGKCARSSLRYAASSPASPSSIANASTWTAWVSRWRPPRCARRPRGPLEHCPVTLARKARRRGWRPCSRRVPRSRTSLQGPRASRPPADAPGAPGALATASLTGVTEAQARGPQRQRGSQATCPPSAEAPTDRASRAPTKSRHPDGGAPRRAGAAARPPTQQRGSARARGARPAPAAGSAASADTRHRAARAGSARRGARRARQAPDRPGFRGSVAAERRAGGGRAQSPSRIAPPPGTKAHCARNPAWAVGSSRTLSSSLPLPPRSLAPSPARAHTREEAVCPLPPLRCRLPTPRDPLAASARRGAALSPDGPLRRAARPHGRRASGGGRRPSATAAIAARYLPPAPPARPRPATQREEAVARCRRAPPSPSVRRVFGRRYTLKLGGSARAASTIGATAGSIGHGGRCRGNPIEARK
eukprot:scaffold89684_cov30-Tisochrysis_lutea.AAC.1